MKNSNFTTEQHKDLLMISNEVETWVQALHPKTLKEISNLEVSTFGNVRMIAYKASNGKFLKSRLLKSQSYSTEYRTIKILGSYHKVHRLLYASFYKQAIPSNMVIDHINEVKSDNRICNLQMITHSANKIKTNEINKAKYGQSRSKKAVVIEKIATGDKYHFESISEAAEFIGSNYDNVSNLCKNNIKQVKGYIAKYA